MTMRTLLGFVLLAIALAAHAQSAATPDAVLPYDLSRNPYQLRGRSVVLDTRRVPLIGTNSANFSIPLPSGNMRFEKMVDEHTALFSVLVGRNEYTEDGQLAVHLKDSTPPELTRPWRVFVEGPTPMVNGYGVSVQITQVRFEGYVEAAIVPTVAEPTPDEQGVYTSSGRLLPQLLHQADAEMTDDARKTHVQGEVTVRIVVGVDGRPHDIQILKGLGHGLDEAAVKAASEYRFRPATLHEKPVPVYLNIGLNFQDF